MDNPADRKSWTEAKKHCRKQGTHLAVIHNSTENDLLWRLHLMYASSRLHIWACHRHWYMILIIHRHRYMIPIIHRHRYMIPIVHRHRYMIPIVHIVWYHYLYLWLYSHMLICRQPGVDNKFWIGLNELNSKKGRLKTEYCWEIR